MDVTTISLICATVVTTVTALVAVFQKNIRKSSCWGGSIEFKSNTPPTPTVTQPVATTPANTMGPSPSASCAEPIHISISSV